MTGDSALSAYVEICRGFGLSNDEIRAIHAGGKVPDGVDPRKVVAKALPGDILLAVNGEASHAGGIPVSRRW